MAHINHVRRIDQLSRLSLRDAIDTSYFKSFATFGGSRMQRNRVCIQELSSFCGQIGIVVLHNDPQLINDLSLLYDYQPELLRSPNNFQMLLANQADNYGRIASYYDPFYGLEQSAILDALAPIQPGARSTTEIQSIRAILSDYLSIMNYQFSSNKAPFGDYAYNLDLLLELTSMPYPFLKDQVLNYLPNNMRDIISGRLSLENAQQKAYNAVLSFSQTLRSFLWSQSGFQNHSRLSIISAVRNKNLICIYIPDSRTDLLDYIALELQQLINYQTPFLLLESGISLNNSQKLKSCFFSEHESLPYFTAIVADNTSSVISQESYNSELASLFSQAQEMFIFECSSTLSAQPFSDGIGDYYRRVVEFHQDSHREPFHIFQSHAHGNIQRELVQKTVTPEELTNLGQGCLLYGKNYPIPVLVNNLIL